MTVIATACEMLKALRSGPIDIVEIEHRSGLTRNCVRLWVREMVAQGIAEQRPKNPQRKGGVSGNPMLYCIAPDWVGKQGAASVR